ncbi:hypothetical protein [Pseudarthrobacter sp. NIBRBAC000502771]|uniref:hypothetical protein n=1 Tax=Pseudarthrobacter sp. NIBRBAC000502771 TaxID=2590774 RepID=UPI00113130A5|nr:hypothetical protein [Pseudarthrobacter sp. NIBRBAC000502771]QDG62564.1 hypothetical protein NIBR502771_09680 [Pseudarthrobacter sp. NIBRBAC000502771]
MRTPIELMQERVSNEAVDGDVAYFKALLRYGEMLTKVAVVNALALLDNEHDHHFRYEAEYSLVRASGVGAWSYELQRLVTGPAKTAFRRDASSLMAQVTQRFSIASEEWQAQVLRLLEAAEQSLGVPTGSVRTEKSAIISFFTRFTNIRNKYDHGAQVLGQVTGAVTPLADALGLLSQRLGLLNLPWVLAHETHAGSPRYLSFSQVEHDLPAVLPKVGLFVLHGEKALPVNLVEALPAGTDVFFANGHYKDKDHTFEALSYVTGAHKRSDGHAYSVEPRLLSQSESEGLAQLDLQGSTWGNLPPRKSDYVERTELERELLDELLNSEMDPIITLGGPGGIGKTSTALQVLHTVAERGDFDLILWFSARDVDLMDAEGAVPVKPKVLSFGDAASSYAQLVREMGFDVSEPAEAFKAALRGNLGDRTLFVFDNFETILEPAALFASLKSNLRLPNKLLITTRFTDFKGQYPIDIGGMEFDEFQELVETTASRLGIVAIVNSNPAFPRSLHRETFGHPYVVKIVLGDIARERKIHKVERVLAKRDDILDALFQRSFERLSVRAQRTFLLLCSWRSVVPLAALDAVQRRSGNQENLDVEAAVEELLVSSMVEVLRPEGREDPRWVNVPAAAFNFGASRVRHHALSSEILADREYLQLLGPLKTAAIDSETLDLSHFFGRVAEELERGALPKDQLMDIAVHLGGAVSGAWRSAARAMRAAGEFKVARKLLTNGPSDVASWQNPDLQLRFDVLYQLSDPTQVVAAVELLRRQLKQRDYYQYNILLQKLSSTFTTKGVQPTQGQRERLLTDVVVAARSHQDFVELKTSNHLAELAGVLGYRTEQKAWRSVSDYKRNPSR